MGASYRQLADAADEAPHAQSLFGGSDGPKRVSDATQYIGNSPTGVLGVVGCPDCG